MNSDGGAERLAPQNSSQVFVSGVRNSHADLDAGLGGEQAVSDLATHDFRGEIRKLIADISHGGFVAIFAVDEVKFECWHFDVLRVKEIASLALLGRVWVDRSLHWRVVDGLESRKVGLISHVSASSLGGEVGGVVRGRRDLEMICLYLFLRARIMRRTLIGKLDSFSAR